MRADPVIKLGDAEIRAVLREQLLAHYNTTDALVMDELGVCQNEARVDIAVIGDTLDGYEIKSPKDTLARLTRQRDVYNRVFDRMSIVCSKEHMEEVIEVIPSWWGVVGVADRPEGVLLQTLRKPGDNPNVISRYLVELLWKDEVLQLLNSYGGDRGFRTQPKRVLWPELANRMDLVTLKREVRETLLSRGDWRAHRVGKRRRKRRVRR